jgi:hypothetical protein
LLANGVSLKEIQAWLGHSDFAITANIYAHLEFDSKLKAAGKMTWIYSTSLASEKVTIPTDEKTSQDDSSIQALPDFINSLVVRGISSETIQAWLKQAEFTSGRSLEDSFSEFQSLITV